MRLYSVEFIDSKWFEDFETSMNNKLEINREETKTFITQLNSEATEKYFLLNLESKNNVENYVIKINECLENQEYNINRLIEWNKKLEEKISIISVENEKLQINLIKYQEDHSNIHKKSLFVRFWDWVKNVNNY